MIKIVDDQFSPERWNKAADHPLQSWEWGEVRKKTGVKVVRIGEFKKDTLINVFQFTLHKIPHMASFLGYLPRSVLPSQEVVDFLYEYGKKNKLIFIKFEPYVDKSILHTPHATIISTMQKSPHQLFPDWTIVLDLAKSEEELLKQMKPKTRYNIRLAEKKSVTVKEVSGKKGFEIFAKLYFETTKRQKYFGHDYMYHKIVWEALQDKVAYILVASFENIPLAAYELFIFKNRAYYPYGGSSLEHKNVMAPNLLMWQAIRFAKQQGAWSFDMWGASSPNSENEDAYAGFTRFKAGYGGEYKQFIGSYDLIINPLLYRLYNSFYKLRSMYLSLSFRFR